MSGFLTRRDRIIALLSTFVDALEDRELDEPMRQAAHNSSRLLLHGPLWNQGDYAKLEVCLAILRGERRDLYWHVSHRYLRCERRKRKFKRQGDRYLGLPSPARVIPGSVVVSPGDGYWTNKQRGQRVSVDGIVETWDERVDTRPKDPDRLPEGGKVEQAIDWLDRAFPGDPMLPKPIYEQLAA